MKPTILVFAGLTLFSLAGLAQVPTGTRQGKSSDTLLKRTVPKANKYDPKATKWPKKDSLKTIEKRKDSIKRKPSNKKKIKPGY